MARVLVVEDDKYLNKLLSDRLSLEGFQVKSVLDGESALHALKEGAETFDILLSDMLLPRMMGAELFTKIHELEKFPDLKIFAMSGVYKDPLQIKEISQLHRLEGYWTKPFDIDTLIASLSGKSISKESQTSNSGDLSGSSIEKLFLETYNRGFTGLLILKRDNLERKIYFSGGFPVGATSTALSESLGQSLIALGSITAAQQEEASRRMVEENLQFGQMLLKMEALSKPQLFEALRKHTYKLLLNGFLMREGTYELSPLAELPNYILPLEFNPMLLIFRAHKAIYAKDFLFELYGQKRNLFGKLHPRALQILPLFNLDENSFAFFQAFSAKADFESILCAIPAEGYETLYRVLFILESLSLLDWSATAAEFETPTAQSADFRKSFDEETKLPAEAIQRLKSEYIEMLSKDFFQILEVTPESPVQDIHDAYRTIRYRLHPDRFGGHFSGEMKRILDDMLTRLDKAYQVLAEPDLKREYLVKQKRLREDSALDSKNFLKAQEIFREGLKFLANQNFQKASETFLHAASLWKRGIEYEMYALFADFKGACARGEESTQQILLEKLLKISGQHPTQDIGFLLLGHAYQASGKMDQAKVSYQKALGLNEKNEEAALALAKIGNIDHKKQRVSNIIRSSTNRIKRYLVWGFVMLAAVAIYTERDRFLNPEQGITEIPAIETEPHFPARSIRIKSDMAKIVLKQDWISDVPEPILRSKCIQVINKMQARGILRLYLYDEKSGLKAQCTSEKLQKY